MALIISPIGLLLFLSLLSSHWPLSQVSGIFYPLWLCGAANLINEFKCPFAENLSKRFRELIFIISAMLLLITIHIPYFWSTIRRYTMSDTARNSQYSLVEINNLATLIGKNKIIIDITKVMRAIPILIELEKRDLALQWSSKSFQTILAYRNWVPPTVDSRIQLYLDLTEDPIKKHCVIRFKGPIYRVLSCQHK